MKMGVDGAEILVLRWMTVVKEGLQMGIGDEWWVQEVVMKGMSDDCRSW